MSKMPDVLTEHEQDLYREYRAGSVLRFLLHRIAALRTENERLEAVIREALEAFDERDWRHMGAALLARRVEVNEKDVE